MRKIVYYVAISIDGFISGPGGDVSGFTAEGDGVDKYLEDLKDYDTVIMGRNTYELGYSFGLQPGQLAYPHMQHYIVSASLSFENQHQGLHVIKPELEEITKIRRQPGTDIYLCGGGLFAGWLLEYRQIDVLKIKLNPFVQSDGVKLFENSKSSYQLELLDTHLYQNGLQIMTYNVSYK